MNFLASVLIGLAVASPYIILLLAHRKDRATYVRWFLLMYAAYFSVSAAVTAGHARGAKSVAIGLLAFFVSGLALYSVRNRPGFLVLWLVVIVLLSSVFLYLGGFLGHQVAE